MITENKKTKQSTKNLQIYQDFRQNNPIDLTQEIDAPKPHKNKNIILPLTKPAPVNQKSVDLQLQQSKQNYPQIVEEKDKVDLVDIDLDDMENALMQSSQLKELNKQKQFVNSYFDSLQQKNEMNWNINQKAGMDDNALNRAKDIIQSSSKNSEFHKSEEEKLAVVKDKVAKYRERVETTRKDKQLWQKFEYNVERRSEKLEREKDFSRTWIHVDMDAFYAAVEIRDDPSLMDIPLAIEDKGMIMTTNYKAREFGVRSGIPGFIGKRLCNEMKFMKPNFPKYKRASIQFKEILFKYDPKLEEIGLDEANMDITDYLKQNKMNNDLGRLFIATKMREEIKEKCNMTASCGIACNRMLAKICSDINKPDGQTFLEFNDKSVSAFMNKLPIRKIPGVGKVNEQILSGMGIKNCPDVQNHAMDISINFTNNAFDFLIRSSMGIAKNVHDELGIKKSINCSETVPLITKKEEFTDQISKLCKELEERARIQKLMGRTITVEFKTDKFKNKQKSYTSSYFMGEYRQFYEISLKLLDDTWPMEPCRKISVNLVNLKDEKGRVSESPHMTMVKNTGGSSKLGGLTKERDLTKEPGKERFSHRLIDYKDADEPKRHIKDEQRRLDKQIHPDKFEKDDRKVNHNHYKDKQNDYMRIRNKFQYFHRNKMKGSLAKKKQFKF